MKNSLHIRIAKPETAENALLYVSKIQRFENNKMIRRFIATKRRKNFVERRFCFSFHYFILFVQSYKSSKLLIEILHNGNEGSYRRTSTVPLNSKFLVLPFALKRYRYVPDGVLVASGDQKSSFRFMFSR